MLICFHKKMICMDFILYFSCVDFLDEKGRFPISQSKVGAFSALNLFFWFFFVGFVLFNVFVNG